MSTNDTYPTMILPLNLEGSIYALQDEKGSTIGTGTREVCELLLHILNRRSFTLTHGEVLARIIREKSTPHVNIRSAIPI
jgi:hypothetical protein